MYKQYNNKQTKQTSNLTNMNRGLGLNINTFTVIYLFLKTELGGGLDGLFDDILNVSDFTEEQKKKVKLFMTLLDKKQDRWISNDAGMLGFIGGMIIYAFTICPNVTERLCQILEDTEAQVQQNKLTEEQYLTATKSLMELKKIHEALQVLPVTEKSPSGEWIERDGKKMLFLEYEHDLPEGFNLRYGTEVRSQ
jgi:hypothetical protein